jgi:hypothetical protein
MIKIEETVYQPRFEAFIQHKKLKLGEEIRTFEYIVWINEKCTHFKKLNGYQILNDEGHEQFTKWLFDTIPQ